MAYYVVSSHLYPFRRENAKFFSQELIEYILHAYGHIWKPKRSTREQRLRAVSGYFFTTDIGRLVLFVSRKYGGFVVMTCFNKWKFIMSLRPSVRGHVLCNEIGRFCNASDLEQYDLGLFTFMAMMAEYARLVIISNQEELVDTIVDALAFCLTDTIPGGFIATLDRLSCIANSFKYPRSYITGDLDPETPFLSPASTLSCHTPRSEFESPLSFIPDDTQYDTPVEEVEAEFKKREFRREYFRRKNMIDCASQTDIDEEFDDHNVPSIAMKTEIVDYILKVEIKTDETSEDLITDGELNLVERCDVYVQTGSINEEKYQSPISDVDDKIATDTNVCPGDSVDLNTVAERPIDTQNSQSSGNVYLIEASTQTVASKPDSSEDETNKGSSERSETCLNPMSILQPATSEAKLAEDLYLRSEAAEQEQSGIAHLRRQLQSIKLKLDSSNTDEGINVSFSDSQSESLPASSCIEKEEKATSTEQDESFDSQIESLNASTYKSSDESNLDN